MRNLFFALVVGASTLCAQQPATSPKPAPVTVTGCLEKAPATGDYTLTNPEGKRFSLRTLSTEIRLMDHVGHRVTVTAAVPPNDPKPEGTTTQVSTLDVIALAMVSETCGN